MKVEGQYTFDGPREILWELVRDPTGPGDMPAGVAERASDGSA